jgi:2-aminophenol/2-amino-5-chlorophenol 1,6-dioxygenase beta subunit
MSAEHIYHHGQYLWDMKMIDLMKKGDVQTIFEVMTDFTEQTISECDAGGLMWMLSAMGMPQTPAKIHGYGTVIGTGNVVAEWRAE